MKKTHPPGQLFSEKSPGVKRLENINFLGGNIKGGIFKNISVWQSLFVSFQSQLDLMWDSYFVCRHAARLSTHQIFWIFFIFFSIYFNFSYQKNYKHLFYLLLNNSECLVKTSSNSWSFPKISLNLCLGNVSTQNGQWGTSLSEYNCEC